MGRWVVSYLELQIKELKAKKNKTVLKSQESSRMKALKELQTSHKYKKEVKKCRM